MNHEPTVDLHTMDYLIRRYTNTAEAHRSLAQHFGELALEEQQKANYWVAERNAYLGSMATNNVVAIPRLPTEGGAA